MIVHWLRNRTASLNRFQFITRPRRGQATIMFALMMVPMLGMMGLVIDGGFYLYAHRTTQAAADAAALAGARQLSQSKPAQAEVDAVAAANGQGGIAPSVQSCRYVNDSNVPVSSGASCGTPPTGASGVMVQTTTTLPTFFIRVIPGAPSSTVTTASAIARVQVASGIAADAPFIVCGYGSWDVTSDPDMKKGGENRSILLQDNPPTINPDAIGRTFRIWDPRLAQEGAGCDANSSFKGLANSDTNANRTVPDWLEIKSGNRTGPTLSSVNGPGGCQSGAQDLDGCVLILPLATIAPHSGGSDEEIYAVGYAAFRMSPANSNSYNGTLLDAYILSAPGSNGWTSDTSGPVSIRLAG